MDRIKQLQQIIKNAHSLHINSKLLDYIGIVEYYPEELVITVKAGTSIAQIQKTLNKNNQALPFYVENNKISIGALYANGGEYLSDSVLGIQIIDGSGELLNFGGQVIKNVAGYDVARLLVGSKGLLALVTQISFKVMPKIYIKNLAKPIQLKSTTKLQQEVEKKLKQVFDPKHIFN